MWRAVLKSTLPIINSQCQALLFNKDKGFREQNSKAVKNHLTKFVLSKLFFRFLSKLINVKSSNESFNTLCKNNNHTFEAFGVLCENSCCPVFNSVVGLDTWLLTQSTNLDLSNFFLCSLSFLDFAWFSASFWPVFFFPTTYCTSYTGLVLVPL